MSPNKSSKSEIQYSAAPIDRIDLTALSATRFIDMTNRRLPYRDELGRINLNLVEQSLKELREDDVAHEAKLRAWERHARRAIASRPEDEQATLEALFADDAAAAAAVSASAVSSTVRGASAAGGEGSAPITVTMPRRLFRKPRPDDEPLFTDDDDVDDESGLLPISADMAYLGRIGALDRAEKRRKARSSSSSTREAEAAKGEAASTALPMPKAVAAKATAAKATAADVCGAAAEDEEDDEYEQAAAMEVAASPPLGKRKRRAASPLVGVGGPKKRLGSSSGDSNDDDDVYEVEAVLEEDESGDGKGFLIRWAGWGPDHDSWEPEDNVAPQLVATFRYERDLARLHQHDDYKIGSTRMLWCSTCSTHLPFDSFSTNQRRHEPCHRSCLNHHYKSSFSPHVSSATGAIHHSPLRATPAAARGRGARSAEAAGASSGRGSSRRVQRDVSPPPRPNKASRPIARALNHRQAALEVQRSRLFGF